MCCTVYNSLTFHCNKIHFQAKIYMSSCCAQETWSYFTAHIGRELFLLLIRYMTIWGIQHRWNTITYMLVNTCPVLLTIHSLLLFPLFPFCDYKKSTSEAPAVCVQDIFSIQVSGCSQRSNGSPL